MTNYPDNGFIFATPQSPEDVIEKIKQRGRIAVPSKNGRILDLLVVSISAPAQVDGYSVSALVEAQLTIYKRVKRFALVVGSEPAPLSIPILWIESPELTGRWIL